MSFSLLLRRDGTNPVDFIIRRGRLALSLDNDAVRDRLYVALTTNLGEWFLDNEDGVPYYTDGGILGGKMTEAEVGAIIRRRILQDPDVDRVESLDVVQVSRRGVSVTAGVVLTTGETVTVTV